MIGNGETKKEEVQYSDEVILNIFKDNLGQMGLIYFKGEKSFIFQYHRINIAFETTFNTIKLSVEKGKQDLEYYNELKINSPLFLEFSELFFKFKKLYGITYGKLAFKKFQTSVYNYYYL